MKKIIGILFLCAALNMQAQYVRPGEENAPPPNAPNQMPSNSFGDKLSLGGSFGLQFGNYTFVELEPLLSYHFNSSFMVGIGPIYQYVNVQASVYGYAYSSSIYGGRISAIYFLPDELSKVFLMGEYDVLNVPEPSLYTSQINRGNIVLPMLGIGYKEQVSDKVFFCIYGLWNFNNSTYSPFTNPIINAGFDVGLWH